MNLTISKLSEDLKCEVFSEQENRLNTTHLSIDTL